jgi:hypothetical protein
MGKAAARAILFADRSFPEVVGVSLDRESVRR